MQSQEAYEILSKFALLKYVLGCASDVGYCVKPVKTIGDSQKTIRLCLRMLARFVVWAWRLLRQGCFFMVGSTSPWMILYLLICYLYQCLKTNNREQQYTVFWCTICAQFQTWPWTNREQTMERPISGVERQKEKWGSFGFKTGSEAVRLDRFCCPMPLSIAVENVVSWNLMAIPRFYLLVLGKCCDPGPGKGTTNLLEIFSLCKKNT